MKPHSTQAHDRRGHSLWVYACEAVFVHLAVHVRPHDYLWEAYELFDAAEQDHRCGAWASHTAKGLHTTSNIHILQRTSHGGHGVRGTRSTGIAEHTACTQMQRWTHTQTDTCTHRRTHTHTPCIAPWPESGQWRPWWSSSSQQTCAVHLSLSARRVHSCPGWAGGPLCPPREGGWQTVGPRRQPGAKGTHANNETTSVGRQ